MSLTRSNGPFQRNLDVVLIAAVVVICGMGAVMIYSASRTRLDRLGLDPRMFAERQILWIALGIGVMAVITAVDYRVLRELSLFAYGGCVLVLLLVLSPLGSSSKGAQAWFDLGPLQLQPSELTKIALIMVLAAYCEEHRGDLDAWRLGVVLTITALPVGLILLQPDLGTAMVLGAIVFTVLLIGGAKPRHLGLIALCGLTGFAGLVYSGNLEQYQVDRLTSFLDQSSNTGDAAYNVNQSKIAIGAGGIGGKGWGEGTQTKLSWVPEQHTDFIFTAVGEELGFLGAGTLLALFAIVVWRTWVTAQLAKDYLGTLVCAGVLAMLTFQIFENIGMTMGIMPITGIPLPFMSYGGSSTLTSFAAVGLVLNVSMRRYT